MSAFQGTLGRLKDALARLRGQWQSVSEVWNDDQRERFNANYMQEYEPALMAAVNELEQIGAIFDQAQRELED